MPATPPENPYDVFISYSHHDSDWVFDWLVPRLKDAGLKICTDRESFELGVPALINMKNAVATSRHTLLVLTPAYMASNWTMYEQLLTQTQDPNGLRQRTIPVLREPCDLPMRIAMLTYADLTGKRDAEAEFAKIVRAVGGTPQPPQAGQPRIQPPAPPAPAQPAFDTAAVRELLMAAFSDEELTTFCYDNFRPVYEEFAAGMSRTQKAQRLMEACDRRGETEQLLARVEQANPYQHSRFAGCLRNAETRSPKRSGPKPSFVPPPANPLGDIDEDQPAFLGAILPSVVPLPANPFGDTLDGQMAGRRLILATDEYEIIEAGIEEGRIDSDLPGYLRAKASQYRWLALIFAGLHTLDEMGHDYRSAFYGQAEHIRVGYLSHDDAIRLITQPHPDFTLEYEPELREELYRLTYGQPYLLQRLCWELVTRWNECFLRESESTPRTLTMDDLASVLTPDFYQAAGYYFDGVWSNVTEAERQLMRVLAGHVEGTWTLAELGEATGLPEDAVQTSLDLLRGHDVIVDEASGVRFAAEPMRRWVAEYEGAA